MGRVPPARSARPDDVRPDDGRVVDLHRDAGHPAGDIRDVCRHRPQEVPRFARGHGHPHGRSRRHGWRSAAGCDSQWRCRDLRRGGSRANPAPPRASVPGRARCQPRRRVEARPRGQRGKAGGFDRRAWQRCGDLPRGGQAWLCNRHRHRPDFGPRPAQLHTNGAVAGRRRGAAARRADRLCQARPREHGSSGRRDGRIPRPRRRGLRLRQQPARGGSPRR